MVSVLQVSELPDVLIECPRLKVLRVEENCLELRAITVQLLKNSNIANLACEGNLFEMREFPHVEGYEEVTHSLILVVELLRYIHSLTHFVVPRAVHSDKEEADLTGSRHFSRAIDQESTRSIAISS